MTTPKPSVSSLVDALNDRLRTRIGDPWRGIFHISIAVDLVHEATDLAKQLKRIGVTYQANFKPDELGTPASKLNELKIIDGMGAPGWTSGQLRRKPTQVASTPQEQAQASRTA
jgi:hypothetical protein